MKKLIFRVYTNISTAKAVSIHSCFSTCGQISFSFPRDTTWAWFSSAKKLCSRICYTLSFFKWHFFSSFFIIFFNLHNHFLKLVSDIFYQILFFHQMKALQKLWKIFFISSKKLFSYLRYSHFCIFFPFFPHFPDSKGQMEVDLWCHELACINL